MWSSWVLRYLIVNDYILDFWWGFFPLKLMKLTKRISTHLKVTNPYTYFILGYGFWWGLGGGGGV